MLIKLSKYLLMAFFTLHNIMYDSIPFYDNKHRDLFFILGWVIRNRVFFKLQQNLIIIIAYCIMCVQVKASSNLSRLISLYGQSITTLIYCTILPNTATLTIFLNLHFDILFLTAAKLVKVQFHHQNCENSYTQRFRVCLLVTWQFLDNSSNVLMHVSTQN